MSSFFQTSLASSLLLLLLLALRVREVHTTGSLIDGALYPTPLPTFQSSGSGEADWDDDRPDLADDDTSDSSGAGSGSGWSEMTTHSTSGFASTGNGGRTTTSPSPSASRPTLVPTLSPSTLSPVPSTIEATTRSPQRISFRYIPDQAQLWLQMNPPVLWSSINASRLALFDTMFIVDASDARNDPSLTLELASTATPPVAATIPTAPGTTSGDKSGASTLGIGIGVGVGGALLLGLLCSFLMLRARRRQGYSRSDFNAGYQRFEKEWLTAVRGAMGASPKMPPRAASIKTTFNPPALDSVSPQMSSTPIKPGPWLAPPLITPEAGPTLKAPALALAQADEGYVWDNFVQPDLDVVAVRDHVTRNPNLLSFHAGEQLRVTQRSRYAGFVYATNAAGHSGLVAQHFLDRDIGDLLSFDVHV
ncbi:uncharacterized protein MONBRDRAFT_5960 [Monosiga brevicollis MX1]|uniref:SH3 domain-containing protein n=1 Tax=Monosiga brevicollis TaxID=81824 RepID=A9UR65_MONBE|nr:uncharacterized protein MONBRDRAFT_5960 [Monosiga brevicollis MX1]EDQ91866.1 predicted protein [Monosiga brevicollis MX1]|eukprot:XP_001743152.1 hypothetical protein [Monosiga brevicollis MX1]